MIGVARSQPDGGPPAPVALVGGRQPGVDADERAAILARRGRGESIRTIAAGVKVSGGRRPQDSQDRREHLANQPDSAPQQERQIQ
ncbi:hypothetical protein [Actinomadura sp. WAC 06369]|uniref:hypothetical protein n=1 Tax=Actinomadura sp. WAC 06369 TaxID=2203193 RepID=UPI000F7B51B8|nr:hypothetical protein [Actinomadura sp. WAC 06369]RSN69790.1 hypothetical protein DMH08_07990 [Actinomadura sp. WAC 06369]